MHLDTADTCTFCVLFFCVHIFSLKICQTILLFLATHSRQFCFLVSIIVECVGRKVDSEHLKIIWRSELCGSSTICAWHAKLFMHCL